MALFEEAGGGDKKKKWIMIAIGTGVIAIFIVIRRSMSAAAANQAAQASSTQTQAATAPTITDTGAYPSDSFGGGISGTGMDQTLSTYLAIADQNTNVQLQGVSQVMQGIQSQMNTNNTALQAQITAMNNKQTVAAVAAAPQPPVVTTPTTTSHPDPTAQTTYVTHTVQKGETLYGLAVGQYGSPHAAMAGGIKTIQNANPAITNPNRIYAGQTIKIPSKM